MGDELAGVGRRRAADRRGAEVGDDVRQPEETEGPETGSDRRRKRTRVDRNSAEVAHDPKQAGRPGRPLMASCRDCRRHCRFGTQGLSGVLRTLGL